MNSSEWRARIDTDTDPETTLGAGFLIDQERVLTCAHVVKGCTSVRVTFPNGPGRLRATVEPVTDWAELNDPGDIALVRLDCPTSLTPARFAQPMGPYWTGDLRAQGFRRGYEETGSYVTLRTGRDMVLGRDWWQLDVDPDRPERLTRGFSGAAVYVADTGEVVGMVSDADLDGGGQMGRMLPVSALRSYWEDLDDLLPLPWLTNADRRELRQIVQVTVPSIRRVFLEAFGGPAPERQFRSVWAAICYVAEERFEEDGLARFLGRLAHHVPADARRRLVAWIRRTLGTRAAASASGEGQAGTSIIIRIERRTHDDTYELTLSTLVNGVPGQMTVPMELKATQVRGEVEERLPALLSDVIGHDWMIEFALPESWLNKAVEQWRAGPRPMLAYPVVVRDVKRLRPDFRRDQAIQRWAVLRQRATTQPEPVGCTNTPTGKQFFHWLNSREDVCVLVHAQRPTHDQLIGALDAGMPVMVWPRSKCSDTVHGECAGERLARELTALIAESEPDDLPRLVKRLRAQAMAQPQDQWHCGRRLTLLWDDPARLPDPPLAMAT